jgi:hypothetical protein
MKRQPLDLAVVEAVQVGFFPGIFSGSLWRRSF